MSKEIFGECGAICYDKECNKTYTEKEYKYLVDWYEGKGKDE